jgi:uncharacterized LabA/DUF88 family protein
MQNPKRRYLFADGACLENASRQWAENYFGTPIEAEPTKLLGYTFGDFDKIFYYDALPIQDRGETDEAWKLRTEPKRTLLERLEQTDRFEVFEGDVRRKGGARDKSRGQKKVDVAIAVDMLTHAFRRNMDEAFLLAGDLDFYPLLKALALEGMPVTLIHPKNATAELKRAALIRRELTPQLLWQLMPTDFLEMWPIPYAIQSTEPHLPGAVVHQRWTGAKGTDYTLLECNDIFHIYQTEPHSLTMQVKHRHRAVLLKYCEEQWGMEIPDSLKV